MTTNKTRIDHYDYSVPVWAICAIEYGDLSGLEPEDVTNLDEFMDRLPKRIYGIEYGDEPSFTHSNDIHNLGDDCVSMKVFVEEKV